MKTKCNYDDQWLEESRKRIREIQEGKRLNNTKNNLMSKYIEACKKEGIKPNI